MRVLFKIFFVAALCSSFYSFGERNNSVKKEDQRVQQQKNNTSSQKTAPVSEIFDQVPKMVDLDKIRKAETVSAKERVEPKLVKIQKEDSKSIVNPDKRIPASVVAEEEEEEIEKGQDHLLSLVQETLFEKEIAKRDLDTVIDEEDWSLKDEDTKEDFGDIEVRWKSSQ